MQDRNQTCHAHGARGVRESTKYRPTCNYISDTSFRHQKGLLRTAVVNSCGSAACRRCWPIGDKGVLTVGMLLVVKRRCSCPRTSLALELAAWEPKVLRSGEVRPRPANDDCSSRGERRPPRSPMPVEKAMVN